MKRIFKSIKNNLPLVPFIIIAGLLLFPIWSHVDQKHDIVSVNSRVDSNSDDLEGLKLVLQGTNEPLVGASTLFAQNASVQLNLAFFGEIKPDGSTCGVNEILKRTGADNWDCAADASGAVPSDSLNFDEFQNPLVLDTHIQVTSGSFTWDFGGASLTSVGTTSFDSWLDVGATGVRLGHDSDGAISFLGLGNGSDENLTLNLDDTANTGIFTSTTGLNKLDFAAIGIELNQDVNLTLGAQTLDHDGTTFVFNDDATFTTGAGSSSFAGSLNISKGLFANTYNNGGLSNCNPVTGKLTWASGLFTCGTDDDIPEVGDFTNLVGGTGIDNNSGTLDLDTTEVEATTWGAGGNATNLWTFNLSAGDPTLNWTGSGATLSLNFEAQGYASASQYFGSAFSGIDCNDATDQLLWSGGVFTCETLTDGDIPDALTIDTGSTLNTLSIGSGVTWTTTGTLTIGDNGDRVDFNTSGWDVANSVFSGLTGLTSTGLIDLGGAVLELPQDQTYDAVGEFGTRTASASSGAFLRVHDGTAERVVQTRTCFGLNYPSPTAKDHISIWNSFDPFTITHVYTVASGSNAVGWNVRHSINGSTFTDLFSVNKSASTSISHLVNPYTTFNDATLTDGERVDFVITSASATIDALFVRICGYYDPI